MADEVIPEERGRVEERAPGWPEAAPRGPQIPS